MAVAIFFQGPRIAYSLFAAGLVDVVLTTSVQVFLREEFSVVYNVRGWILIFTFLILFAFRRWDLRRSRKMVLPDQQRYDELWLQCCQDEDSRMGIEHLKNVVRMIGLDERNYCRQKNRACADQLPRALRLQYENAMKEEQTTHRLNPIFLEIRKLPVQGQPSRQSVLASFDQLYAQAALAGLLLRQRLRVWAKATDGMFEARRAVGFARYADLLDQETGEDDVKWPAMKRQERAFEKMLRVYGGDASHLLDIARSCLVFDTMTSLTNCLGMIITDEYVRVERIKNRMDMSYDSNATGGYRDVCINLKMQNSQAIAVGADLHICEVQLILREFAELRTSEGHRRYVQARNVRGD